MTSRWHSFTDPRILHIAQTTGSIYRIRKAKKKGHLFFGQTVSMKDQLLERSRRLSDKPRASLHTAISNYGGRALTKSRNYEPTKSSCPSTSSRPTIDTGNAAQPRRERNALPGLSPLEPQKSHVLPTPDPNRCADRESQGREG